MTIVITKTYARWALANIRREQPARYKAAKTPEARIALVQEYVRSVLSEHKESWEDLNR